MTSLVQADDARNPTAVLPDAAEANCLLHLPPAAIRRRLAAADWNFTEARSDDLTHPLHPYPARFVPPLPRQAILALSRPGETVLDPFAGGGTTAVEALSLGRSSYMVDANAVANAITLAKTIPLAKGDLLALQRLETTLLSLQPSDMADATPPWLPAIPNRDKWYDAGVFHALGVVRSLVTSVEGAAGGFALVAFVQAAARLSFQESETRYTSRPREIEALEVPRTVLSELRRMRRIIERGNTPGTRGLSTIVDGDARDATSYSELRPGSAGLIVTSPPYPNAYDYHLYHRFRLFWLGVDPRELRQVELGSHLKNQADANAPETYVADMKSVLGHCYEALAPGRWLVMVVGDGLFHGTIFQTAEHLRVAAEGVGFEDFGWIDRELPVNRRSVTQAGRRLTHEQVMFLRRPSDRNAHIADPNYRLFPYERELQLRELRALGGSPLVEGEAVAVAADENLSRVAFAHGWHRSDGIAHPTLQSLFESSDGSTRRKNSTYFLHGLHRYKGKFYPQLAKALMNLAALEPGESLVVDPFGGSGTVALEAVLNGVDAVSIDTNPVATAIARAKTAAAAIPPERFAAATERVRTSVVTLALRTASRQHRLSELPSTALEELERWFPGTVLRKLDRLLVVIRAEPDKGLVLFFEALVSDLIRDVSQQEPKDLRIRRRAEPIEDAPVFELFLERLKTASGRVAAFWQTASIGRLGVAEILHADASKTATFDALNGRRIDAVVSSPPYAAALPYIDTDRLSLAALLGLSSAERKHLEQAMIGSREITTKQRASGEAVIRDRTDDRLPSSTFDFLNALQSAVAADQSAGFRRQQSPAVLLRYFASMSDVIANLRAHMTKGSSGWFVLGDSRSTIGGKPWTIPTVDEVAAIAEHVGLAITDRIPITVTREDVLHSRHAITRNVILQFEA